jgi:hypothetical protein
MGGTCASKHRAARIEPTLAAADRVRLRYRAGVRILFAVLMDGCPRHRAVAVSSWRVAAVTRDHPPTPLPW